MRHPSTVQEPPLDVSNTLHLSNLHHVWLFGARTPANPVFPRKEPHERFEPSASHELWIIKENALRGTNVADPHFAAELLK